MWFLESRPDESGRVVVRRWSAETGVVDVTPEGTNVRTRVHEYGGGAWAVRDGSHALTDTSCEQFAGDRELVRELTVAHALQGILERIES